MTTLERADRADDVQHSPSTRKRHAASGHSQPSAKMIEILQHLSRMILIQQAAYFSLFFLVN